VRFGLSCPAGGSPSGHCQEPAWQWRRIARLESAGKVFAALDAEFAVSVCEVCLDGPQGDEQSLRDFSVGAALGGEHGDSALAGGQRVATAQFVASGARAGRKQFGASGGRECRGSTLGGKVERFAKRCASGGSSARAA
jgi:hypothetical protein